MSKSKQYELFFAKLKRTKFSGDICTREDDRLLMATDNSIYHIMPYGVLYPRDKKDVQIAMQLASETQGVSITPRGGGTGTNGQSLNYGVILDVSRYMNRILEFNEQEQTIKVEPGVVRDKLNVYLKEWGLYFAPDLSTSNRATIGGMVNTDACGKASSVEGRTGDYIDDLEVVLVNGDSIRTKSYQDDAKKEKILSLKEVAKPFLEEQACLARYQTGYNLDKAGKEDKIDWKYIFAGSEGTIGVVTEATLKLTKIPKREWLLCLYYSDFDTALRDVSFIRKSKPQAIETIDSTILSLAKQDPIYEQIKSLLPENTDTLQAVNLVAFVSQSQIDENAWIDQIKSAVSAKVMEHRILQDAQEQKVMWELRKKGVGLLGNLPGNRRPVAFVEDTMVAPELLADYIKEFRSILDKENVFYGMFGHVDAGCLHVRPSLDLRDKQDREKVWRISKQVFTLLKKYKGTYWGEHGKGFRSSFAPSFLGSSLYQCMQEVKKLFDANNKLNPGKIASPSSQDSLYSLQSPLRGEEMARIPKKQASKYETALYCNGNGACFNALDTSLICPSFQGTQNRVYSPKGRAELLKAWLAGKSRFQFSIPFISKAIYSILRIIRPDHRDHLVKQSFDLCLSCKACRTQCPIKVDISAFKFTFLHTYYKKYYRPIGDVLIRFFEQSLAWQAKFPRIINYILDTSLGKGFLSKLGWVDIKKFSSPALHARLKKTGNLTSLQALKKLTDQEKAKTVVLLQDAFTSFYEASLVEDCIKLSKELGYTMYVFPFFPNGKALHIKGYKRAFTKYKHKNSKLLQKLGSLGIPLVGIDPAVVLTYRDEYQEDTKLVLKNIFLLQEWLLPVVKQRNEVQETTEKYYLLGHCSEKIIATHSQEQWQEIFQHLGKELQVIPTGCCGMAGMFGHEKKNKEISRFIYNRNWGELVQLHKDNLLVTGYSCRTQIQRFDNYVVRHPLQVLFKKQ